MTYSEKLSKFFVDLKYEDIPEAKIQEMKKILIDYVSCAYGGTKTESGRITARYARDFAGDGKCTVVGLGYRSTPYNAAFANAILAHSIELDDIDVLAYFHNAPQTVSASLAAAEWADVSGKEFLTGLACGFEMLNRLSEAVNPMLRNRGFHTTPSCGVFGAGVAAGKIMGLTYEQMVSDIGLCGAQASGLMEMYGTSMAKRFNPGPAARNGVTAALFAQRGFTGAETIFEGKRGFCKSFAGEYNLEKLTENLGSDWRFAFEYKPYACARPIHNAIDCALNITREHHPNLSEVKSILVKRHSEWGTTYHNIKEPRSYHEAQMSLQFSAALAFTIGKVFIDQYSDENLRNPAIMGLSNMIDIADDDTLPRGVSCNMIMTMKDGSEYTSQVDYPKGSIQNPMSPEEHAAKFESLSAHLLSAAERTAIIDKINNLEKAKSIFEFSLLLGMN